MIFFTLSLVYFFVLFNISVLITFFLISVSFEEEDRFLMYLLDLKDIVINTSNKIFIEFGYNLFYFYSFLEIKYTQLCNKFVNFLIFLNIYKTHSVLFDNKITALFIQDGNIRMSLEHPKTSVSDCDVDATVPELGSYDIVIYEIKRNGKSYKMICKKFIPFNDIIVLEATDYTFLNVSLIILNEKIYNIFLSNDTTSYYVVGNTIDKNFIKYYYKNVIGEKNENIEKYILQVLDNNVKLNIIDETQELIMEEEKYVIKNTNNNFIIN